MLSVRDPLSRRNVEDLLHERDLKVSYETVQVWWRRSGRIFADGIP
jgi:putative transposase